MLSRESDAERIFLEAVENCTPESFSDFVERACGDDTELRERVEALWQAHDKPNRLLDGGIAATTDLPVIAERPGTQIGPYKLHQEIGEGGMGIVYMAQQKEPVRRTVALKIIKPGMDTSEVVARFAAEKQALAIMDHPNIAKLHDAGTTESGQPYFVMELVNGVTLTQYCDDNKLSIRERLELFASICHAVQHAHQKGIIHRDIKPSNILITLHDGVPVPKIIDFGVAKAITGGLSAETLVTGFGELLGTPRYMSPEQAERSGLDIDTRSDIYSLGVLLYELLTGSTPFDREQFKNADLDEVRRLIREEEPPRPSTRISTLGQLATTVAEHRRTSPVELSNALRHELDWIVMKALEKDRTRRYQTATDLAQDLERYLRDEPVEACPPSAVYRFGKFARRHKTILAATSVVVLCSLAVSIAVLLYALAARDAAESRSVLTERRLRVQQGINDALAEVARLRESRSVAERGDEAIVTACREQLKLARGLAEGGPIDPELLTPLRALEQELNNEQAELDQDRRDRELIQTLEAAWLVQANVDIRERRFALDDSVPVLRGALEKYGIRVVESPVADVAAVITSRPPDVRQTLLEALEELSVLARPIIGLGLKTADGTPVIADIAPDSPAARDGRLRVGDKLIGCGEGRQGEIVNITSWAIPAIREVLSGQSGTTVRLEVIPTGESESRIYEIQRDPTAAWTRAVVDVADSDPWRCSLREARKHTDPAKRLEALTPLAEQVDVQTQPVRVLTRLAGQLGELGDQLGVPGARKCATALLRRVQTAYPDDLWANANLAEDLRHSSPPQLEEAIRYYTAAIALRPDSAGLHVNLGVVLDESGRAEEAIVEYRESLRIAPAHATPRCNLVDTLIELGKEAEAEAVAREAVQRWPQAATFANLGRALRQLRKNEEATAAFHEALRLDPEIVRLQAMIAIEMFAAGRKEESVEQLRDVIAMDPTDATYHYNLGVTLGELGRVDEACDAYRACLKLDPSIVSAFSNLSLILQQQGRAEEAVQVCRDLLARKPDSAVMYGSLGHCLSACDREEEAIAAFRESIRLDPRGKYLNLAYVSLAKRLATARNPAVRNVEEAVAVAAQAVELAPQEELAWEALGIARFHSQEWQASIEAFQKAESFVDTRKYGTRYTHSAQSWCENRFYLAMGYWQLGQVDEARAWFVVGEHELDRWDLDRAATVLQDAATMLGMNLNESRSTQETIAAYRATLKTHPAGGVRHNELAWLLATTPDVPYRDPAQAVEHALQAVKLMPYEASTWNTLGVAYYRNGQWDEAIEALKKSLDLSSGGMAVDWLFLAMAHWQRGAQDESLKWYNRALTYDPPPPGAYIRDLEDATLTLTEEIARFRAEAEELLGIQKAESEQSKALGGKVPADTTAPASEPVGTVPATPPKEP